MLKSVYFFIANTSLRRLTSLGLEVSKEQITKDIQKEITMQSLIFEMNDDFSIDSPSENINSQIDILKSNLGDIFEKERNTTLKQPIQSKDDYQQMIEQLSSPVVDVQQSQQKQQLREEYEREMKKLGELLDKSANMPNEPTIVRLGGESQQPQNIWDDLNGIDPNSEEYLNLFERLYEIQVERLAILKANNSPDFESQLNFAVQNILNRTDRMPNARDQLLDDVNYYLSHSMTNNIENNKDELIFSVIQYMYPDGVEYVPINDIKKQLETYTEEQLEEMISQYKIQDQELSSSGMHR